MKARLIVALLLGCISYQSLFNNECQATLLKSKTKADSDDVEDLVEQALTKGFSTGQKSSKS